MSNITLADRTAAIIDSIGGLGVELTKEQTHQLERDIESVLYSHGREVKHQCANAINKLQVELVTQTGDIREELLVDNVFTYSQSAALSVEIDI